MPIQTDLQRVDELAAEKEQKYADIKALHSEGLTSQEIAEILDVPDRTVRYVTKKFRENMSETGAAIKELMKKPYWQELKNQFTNDELNLFSRHWHNIIQQFRNDTFYTEELQIVEVCKLEILMNRVLADIQDTRLAIEKLKKDIASGDLDDDEKSEAENQLINSKIALTQFNKEHKDLLADKKGMMKDIKGSREQRIKQLESSRESFGGWFRQLMTDHFRRKITGEWMEKNRLAHEYEVIRLSEIHQYENGEFDYPFLNADTMRKVKENEDKEKELENKDE